MDIQLWRELDRLEETAWEDMTPAERRRCLELADVAYAHVGDESNAGSLLPCPE